MQKSPRVSVLTPIYNTNPSHLCEMVESILNQTFTDFEFLILNDSPDNKEIEKIVLGYAKKDKRVKYFKNDKNMGITPSRNKLLKMARGEYIAIFDHDDISVPNRLKLEVDFLDKNPSIGVVSGFMQNFGAKNTIRTTPEYDVDIKIALTDNCVFWHTAAMIRKSVLVDNDIEYEEYYSPCEDYRLFSRLMNVTLFHALQTVLVNYRMSENQTSVRQKARMNIMHHTIQMDIINRFPAYRKAWCDSDAYTTRFRLRLFGKIPLLKIKHNWVLLFEFIPLFKIKWK
ncbi:MAG: glycosyltransferase family 2 protein [Alphaproteobacteria bacterium]|nr:glycosyltransferase family 2 protein [Alphaproteobacteria bacterium]